MRKIICRFANQNDLDTFNERNGDREKDNREYIEAHIEECEKISLDNFEL